MCTNMVLTMSSGLVSPSWLDFGEDRSRGGLDLGELDLSEDWSSQGFVLEKLDLSEDWSSRGLALEELDLSEDKPSTIFMLQPVTFPILKQISERRWAYNN